MIEKIKKRTNNELMKYYKKMFRKGQNVSVFRLEKEKVMGSIESINKTSIRICTKKKEYKSVSFDEILYISPEVA